jgi:aspartyl-tRNA(Asn)/glutamyl-tRNA(Gln) amidotransferase subunit C
VVGDVADADIPPTSHAVPTSNVFREDVLRPCLTPEEALSGAPESEQQRFSVPRILDEEA